MMEAISAVVISAFTVETNPVGFRVCSWPANTRREAENLGKALSEKHANNPHYPNAFWINRGDNKALGKWFKGNRYDRMQTV